MAAASAEAAAALSPLAGRTVLVTGANRGIGLALVQRLAREGARVIVHARTEAAARTVVEELSAPAARPPRRAESKDDDGDDDDDDGSWQHVAVSGDFGKAEESAAQVVEQLGAAKVVALDAVVHNAAILGPANTAMESTSAADLRELLEVNVTSVFALNTALVPLLRAGSSPAVFLTSGAGRRRESGFNGMGLYACSKFAIEGLANALFHEHGHEFRINSVNPGRTRTTMRASAAPDEDPLSIPAPEDIMPLFLWLCRADTQLNGATEDAQAWMDRDWKTYVPASTAWTPGPSH